MNNKGEKVWTASGFLYGSATSDKTEDGKTIYVTFLVSNRHVFEGLDTAYMRINPREAKPPTDYPLQLMDENRRPQWFAHPSNDVDIAVFAIDMAYLKELGMQVDFFPNDLTAASRSILSEVGVTEGDFVYTLGFPLGLVGKERNFVIVRQGIIARIRDTLANVEDNYLIDAFVFPGNSGGPVVLKPELVHIDKTKVVQRSYLIGVVKGYVPYREVAISQQTLQPRIMFEENSGLAEVIPIDRVDECIQAFMTAKTPKIVT